MAARKA
jgi:hypothetical protein